MGRKPCCSKVGLNRGAWSTREDKILMDHINNHGEGKWRDLPKRAGLNRCGKSCRLRWLNYLRPGIKRGNISCDEEELIIRLHKLLGNRWSLIAGRLPGRTDNEIKNYWNTHLSKKLSSPPSRQGSNADRVARKQTKKVVDVEATEQSHQVLTRKKAALTKAGYKPDDSPIANNISEPTSTDDQRSSSPPFDTFLDLPIDFDIVEEFMAGIECNSGFDHICDDEINPSQLYDTTTTQDDHREIHDLHPQLDHHVASDLRTLSALLDSEDEMGA